MKKAVLLTLAMSLLSLNFWGQTKLTANSIRLDDPGKAETASLSDIEWIAGNWSGTGLGGYVREIWTKTGGSEMIGLFSYVKDGKAVFYEFMQFSVTNGNLILRLKHFNPDMTGWEEKDKTIDFPFVKKEKRRMYFRGLTLENAGNKKLNIYLALKDKENNYREEVFNFTLTDK